MAQLPSRVETIAVIVNPGVDQSRPEMQEQRGGQRIVEIDAVGIGIDQPGLAVAGRRTGSL